ncbi:MAG: hypothetical protein LBR65_04785 [Culturomica sp.]|jgi:hypothetical protein|nr:hypothetical protein [Culturomica sp.]
MKAKTHELFENFSGSTGGITATHAAGHLLVRKKVSPNDANTEAQKAIRKHFTLYAQKWTRLTIEQQRKWNEQARQVSAEKSYFGIFGKVSGFNLYVKCNMNLELINAPNELTEPARDLPQSTPFIELFEVTSTEMTVELSENVHAGDTLVVRAAPLKSGLSNNTNGLRQIATIAGGQNMAEIKEKYRAVFGEPVAGERIQLQVYAINKLSGYASGRREAMSNVIVVEP